jgi:hypothetical protein
MSRPNQGLKVTDMTMFFRFSWKFVSTSGEKSYEITSKLLEFPTGFGSLCASLPRIKSKQPKGITQGAGAR